MWVNDTFTLPPFRNIELLFSRPLGTSDKAEDGIPFQAHNKKLILSEPHKWWA